MAKHPKLSSRVVCPSCKKSFPSFMLHTAGEIETSRLLEKSLELFEDREGRIVGEWREGLVPDGKKSEFLLVLREETSNRIDGDIEWVERVLTIDTFFWGSRWLGRDGVPYSPCIAKGIPDISRKERFAVIYPSAIFDEKEGD